MGRRSEARGLLRQHAADLIRLFLPRAGDGLPDLLLAAVIRGDGEGHQLLERHALVGIDLEQRGRNRGESQGWFTTLGEHVAHTVPRKSPNCDECGAIAG